MGTPGGAGTTRLRFAFPPLPSHARRRAPDCAAFSLPGRPSSRRLCSTPTPRFRHLPAPRSARLSPASASFPANFVPPPPSGPTLSPTPRFRRAPGCRASSLAFLPPALSPSCGHAPPAFVALPAPHSPRPPGPGPHVRLPPPRPLLFRSPSPMPSHAPAAYPSLLPPARLRLCRSLHPTRYTYTRAARTHASFHALFLPV